MKNKYKICIKLAILLFMMFIGFIVYDYINYNPMYTSAPFSVNILIRSIEFLLPCLILLIIGLILKKGRK